MYFPLLFLALLHRGDLWVRKYSGCHAGQRRNLSNHRRACPECRGSAEHFESYALVWHVRLLWPDGFSCEYRSKWLCKLRSIKHRISSVGSLWELNIFVKWSKLSSPRWECRPNRGCPVPFCWWSPTSWGWCVGLLLWTEWETVFGEYTFVWWGQYVIVY